eukprot:TRINITY_DN676_c0_g1_i1.p1 TRINITY_DN676_c0_g1~~TRINITY_DN676_c0_g1_i1.p1  ORF type:complete len:438 (+),score=59.68 TRINITY_DN676_c0_g1_i1:35-1348(+)
MNEAQGSPEADSSAPSPSPSSGPIDEASALLSPHGGHHHNHLPPLLPNSNRTSSISHAGTISSNGSASALHRQTHNIKYHYHRQQYNSHNPVIDSNRRTRASQHRFRLTTLDRLEMLGERPEDSRTICLQIMAETVLFAGVLCCIPLIMVKLQIRASWKWTLVVMPLWIADGVCLVLFVAALFAPLPYLKQLARLGVPRVGDNPSGTELISITLSVIMKILALCLMIIFEVAIAKMLDSNRFTLIQSGTSLFCLQGLGLCYALLIEDHSLQVLAIDISSILFYLLLAVRFQFNFVFSFWIVFFPLHILVCCIFFWLILRRVKTHSTWNLLKSTTWGGLFVGTLFHELFLIILCRNLEFLDTPEKMLSPILLLTPFLLGLFFWMLPVCLYAGQFIEPLSLAVDYFEMSQGDREELIYREPLIGHSLNGDDESDETWIV